MALNPPARLAVRHKPVQSPAVGNWAVVTRQTGRIRSRHRTAALARASARARGRGVRRTRAKRR